MKQSLLRDLVSFNGNHGMFIQHSNIFAKLPFSVGTPRTNRNNGCPWEGLKEKIDITSEEGFYLENPEVN